jgi:hypothetical protein
MPETPNLTTEVVNPIVTKVIDRLAKESDKTLTMYRLSVVWSDLKGSRVREQQCYNYRKVGRFTNLVDGRITKDEAKSFLISVLTKKS